MPTKSSLSKRVVVLGGGIGGVACARALRKRLPSESQVTLVDASAEHVYLPSLLWVTFGSRKPESIKRPFSILERQGIGFHQGRVTSIEVDSGQVETDTGDLEYDFLVIALGADLAPERVPGLAEGAHIFYSSKGALSASKAISEFDGGRAVIAISAMPYKCPAAPYETACLLDAALRKRGVRGRSQIDVITFEPLPMPTAGPEVGKALRGVLESKNIGFQPQSTLASVDSVTKQLLYSDGRTADYDLLLAVPPHASPPPVANSQIAGEGGWIPVDPGTLRTKHDNVYALGDVTAVKLKNGRMLPKAGVFAHHQADVAARLIAGRIRDADADGDSRFDGKGGCFVEVGDGAAAFGSGDFYAEPDPQIRLRPPKRRYRWQKTLVEKWWLRSNF